MFSHVIYFVHTLRVVERYIYLIDVSMCPLHDLATATGTGHVHMGAGHTSMHYFYVIH